MNNKLKEFYKKVIEVLSNEGCDNPIRMMSPLMENMSHSQYQRLLGHINTYTDCNMTYINESGGYSEGILIINFSFNKARSKRYYIEFTSKLVGDYGTTEFWKPLISVSVCMTVGDTDWRGTEKELLNFENQYQESCNKESEIERLKIEIAERQRVLAKLTV